MDDDDGDCVMVEENCCVLAGERARVSKKRRISQGDAQCAVRLRPSWVDEKERAVGVDGGEVREGREMAGRAERGEGRFWDADATCTTEKEWLWNGTTGKAALRCHKVHSRGQERGFRGKGLVVIKVGAKMTCEWRERNLDFRKLMLPIYMAMLRAPQRDLGQGSMFNAVTTLSSG